MWSFITKVSDMNTHFSPRVLRELKELGFDHSNLKIVPLNETCGYLIERFEFPIEGGNGNFYIHITMEVQNATITFVRAALVKSNDNNDINEDWAAITYNATIPSRAEMINSIERIVHSTRMADKLHHLKDQSSLQPGKSLKFR